MPVSFSRGEKSTMAKSSQKSAELVERDYAHRWSTSSFSSAGRSGSSATISKAASAEILAVGPSARPSLDIHLN